MLRGCLLLAALIFVAIGSSKGDLFQIRCKCFQFLLNIVVLLAILSVTFSKFSILCLSYKFSKTLCMEWVDGHRLLCFQNFGSIYRLSDIAQVFLPIVLLAV